MLLSIELLIFLFVGIILGAAAIVGAAVITAATPSCSASAAASLQANSSLAGASTWPVLYGGETYEVIKFMDANSGQLSVEEELFSIHDRITLHYLALSYITSRKPVPTAVL